MRAMRSRAALCAAALLLAACGPGGGADNAPSQGGTAGSGAAQGGDAAKATAAAGRPTSSSAKGAEPAWSAEGTEPSSSAKAPAPLWSAAGSGTAGPVRTVTVQGPDTTVTGWIAQAAPDPMAANAPDAIASLKSGLDAKGRKRDALVRFTLPAGVTPDRLASATARVRLIKGDAPAFRVGVVTADWSPAVVGWDALGSRLLFPFGDRPTRALGGGWYAVDVTEAVRGWLSGKWANYGIALEETRTGARSAYGPAAGDDLSSIPALDVTYAEAAGAAPMARFAYTPDRRESVNCMAYALRHGKAILLEDLGLDDAEIDAAGAAGGTDRVLATVAAAVEAYMDAHAGQLGLAAWRRIDAFDSAIDPAAEYRIALRVGYHTADGETDFDYHFQAQVADGSWAEKLPSVPSRRVPGSNAALDPAAHPWDGNYEWGYFKWDDTYDSPAAFYAIAKTR